MDWLSEAHRRCDLLLAAAKEAFERADWPAFRARINEFRDALHAHFAAEIGRAHV